MRLVQLNASVGMKTVAYWRPVLGHIAAWDMGDEFDPAGKEWDILKSRWAIMRSVVEPATGVAPFTNSLPFVDAISRTLTDLPGSERLVSFAQYGGDLGVGLAKQFDPRARLMCAVN